MVTLMDGTWYENDIKYGVMRSLQGVSHSGWMQLQTDAHAGRRASAGDRDG